MHTWVCHTKRNSEWGWELKEQETTMKGERMRRLDLHINESSLVIGNFLSLHFSFSFSTTYRLVGFFSSSALCVISCLFHSVQEQCEVGSYPDFWEVQKQGYEPVLLHSGKSSAKRNWYRNRAKFSNIPLLKEEFSIIPRRMTVSCLQDCC